MRHLRKTRKLGWKTAHRQANLRNMVTSLLKYGRIITTVPRAKELRKIADKMVTLAKDGSLHAKRQAFAFIRDRDVVARLFTHWKETMQYRNGGYCRLVKIGNRVGDASPMTIVEMVTESFSKSEDKKKKSFSSESQIRKNDERKISKEAPISHFNEVKEEIKKEEDIAPNLEYLKDFNDELEEISKEVTQDKNEMQSQEDSIKTEEKNNSETDSNLVEDDTKKQ